MQGKNRNIACDFEIRDNDPNFVFLSFLGPLVSKGIDGDLSAYIPGKKSKRFLLQISHFPNLVIALLRRFDLTEKTPIASFQEVVECPPFPCTPQPEVTWLMTLTAYPTIHCSL